MFLAIIEFLAIVTILILLVTQVMTPLIQNRKTFPLFRKRATIEAEIAGLNSQLDEQQLTAQRDELRDRVESIGKDNKLADQVTKPASGQ